MNYECDNKNCYARFNTFDSYQKHKYSHVRNKELTRCFHDNCPTSTDKYSYLRNHINLKHKRIDDTAIEILPSTSNSIIYASTSVDFSTDVIVNKEPFGYEKTLEMYMSTFSKYKVNNTYVIPFFRFTLPKRNKHILE